MIKNGIIDFDERSIKLDDFNEESLISDGPDDNAKKMSKLRPSLPIPNLTPIKE